ncbi:MAG: O-antigen ligase family protein, partial [Patescibacteria group bacterium]
MMIEKTLRLIVLSGIFALPFIVFIVAQSLFFPFITGKNFAFRIIVEIITGAYLALALANPIFRPKRSWLLGLFALFVIVVAVADALGVAPFKSFWSNYERMDGWVTLAHLFLYFLVASNVLNTEKLWRTFWHVSLSVSAVVGTYGLLQLAGFASLNPGFSSLSRIDATFGNPIYLAVYMLFNIGIAAMLWARTWQDSKPGKRVWFSALYGGVIALDLLILLMTGTRGTILGLIGGVVLSALLIGFASPTMRRFAIITVVGILIAGGGFWLVRGEAWIQKIPVLHRLATISLEDNTTKARFMNWGMAWAGVKERPILGWGQENYAIVFDKYYNPRMYAQEQWFDRVHNIIFDWLVAAGFVGLVSYISILISALWLLWRPNVERGSTEASTPNVKKNETNTFSTVEASILTGLLAAYFFHNLFVFDNITSYILFASVLAYIAWRGSYGTASLNIPSVSARALPVVAVCAVILVFGATWLVNGKALVANRALLHGLGRQQGGLQKNLEYFKESISYES